MLVEGIKSRPIYTTLSPRPGREHLVVAEGEGALAALDLLRAADDDFARRTRVVYVPGASAARSHGDVLGALTVAGYDQVPSADAAAALLAELLASARMGSQVYLAGTEDFIGRTMQVALEAGIDHQAIQAEHRGSLERRVQCVHCKAITDHVRTQPVACSGCGLTLLVRDHYSRRIGAFQGVCIDAEEPGTAPAPEEVFA
jgi:dimethylamine monooxygenase subunit C